MNMSERPSSFSAFVEDHISQIPALQLLQNMGYVYLRQQEVHLERRGQMLKDVAVADGLIRTNEQVYDLISLGKSFEQTIDGDTKSFTLNYVDWIRPENNIFHVAEEFEVERASGAETCRLDIALFVNGIPFAMIECKRPDEKDSIKTAISRHLRNQGGEFIPRLFVYSQLLVAINQKEAKYATTGTPPEFWAQWREREDVVQQVNEEVGRLVNKP